MSEIKTDHKPNYTKPAVGRMERYLFEPKGSTFATARRVVALVVEDNNDGKVKYAASVFRREKDNETRFGRKNFSKTIRRTAHKRFAEKPVVFDFAPSDALSETVRKSLTKDDFHAARQHRTDEVLKTVRKQMFTKGVTAKGIIDKTKYTKPKFSGFSA